MIKKILIAEDDPLIRKFLQKALLKNSREIVFAENGEVAIEYLRLHSFDLILTDMKMPKKTGKEVLAFAKNFHPQTPLVFMTAYGTIEDAVDAMKEGAFHYLIKPFSLEALEVVLEKAKEHLRLLQENHTLRQEILSSKKNPPILAEDPLMKRLLCDVEKIAKSNATVFISGESGTGKEVLAHLLHTHSLRKDHPFIKVNCAAIADTLIESEFFGHEKGAFTGALSRKEGRFELANGGTILLDEVTEIPSLLQPKLLRVLQEQEIERVGGTRAIPIDVRIIATSNRNMKEAIESKLFREDLYFRLNVIPLKIPSLRERKKDILPLASHFLEYFCIENHKEKKELSSNAEQKLLHYPWPGNVRELCNLMERVVVLESSKVIDAEKLPLEPSARGKLPCERKENHSLLQEIQKKIEEPELSITLEEMEKKLILTTLASKNQNRTQTAKTLGINLRTLRNKLKRYQNSSEKPQVQKSPSDPEQLFIPF